MRLALGPAESAASEPGLAGDTTVPRGAAARRRRAVFIDKDGTLITDVPYNVDPAHLAFTTGAFDGLRLLQSAGYLLIVISNQPGLALGKFGRDGLDRLALALARRLAGEGIALDGFYACPHAPVDRSVWRALACRCRKPAPGLLLEAARDHGIDLKASWMVGDILDDVEAGWRAGCRSVLLDVGNETVWRRSPIRTPTRIAPDLLAAARAVLGADEPHPAASRTRRLKAPAGPAAPRTADPLLS